MAFAPLTPPLGWGRSGPETAVSSAANPKELSGAQILRRSLTVQQAPALAVACFCHHWTLYWVAVKEFIQITMMGTYNTLYGVWILVTYIKFLNSNPAWGRKEEPIDRKPAAEGYEKCLMNRFFESCQTPASVVVSSGMLCLHPCSSNIAWTWGWVHLSSQNLVIPWSAAAFRSKA